MISIDSTDALILLSVNKCRTVTDFDCNIWVRRIFFLKRTYDIFLQKFNQCSE